MLQALLAERFKAVVRRETKDENVYLLTVGKDGPKLKAGDRTRSGPEHRWTSYYRPSRNGNRVDRLL